MKHKVIIILSLGIVTIWNFVLALSHPITIEGCIAIGIVCLCLVLAWYVNHLLEGQEYRDLFSREAF